MHSKLNLLVGADDDPIARFGSEAVQAGVDGVIGSLTRSHKARQDLTVTARFGLTGRGIIEINLSALAAQTAKFLHQLNQLHFVVYGSQVQTRYLGD
jgi:hypothetical protein